MVFLCTNYTPDQIDTLVIDLMKRTDENIQLVVIELGGDILYV